MSILLLTLLLIKALLIEHLLKDLLFAEAASGANLLKKVPLEISQNSRENICARVSFLIKRAITNKETLAQVFSCEFWETFKNTFSYRSSPVAGYVFVKNYNWISIFFLKQLKRLHVLRKYTGRE